MSTPGISVVMPVYNGEDFLGEAIESILAQTYKDFEFIIVDDGSTDRSAAIISSFRDERIVLLKNECNSGIMTSLNKGIAHARAPYIARMDADDISYPDRLEKQLQFIGQYPDGALWSCWTRVITADKKVVRLEAFKPDYYYFNFIFECWIYHPTIVFSREKLAQIGHYTVPFAEDYELIWQVSRQFKMYHQPEALLDYRITQQSLHRVLKKEEYEEAFHNMVLRNISYYMGTGFTIQEEELQCLRHQFSSLVETKNLTAIAGSLKKLEQITQQVYQTPNINRVPGKILEAARHKRAFILDFFFRALPRHKAVVLAYKTNSWRLFFRIAGSHFSRKLLRSSHLK